MSDVGACACGAPLRSIQFDSWRAIHGLSAGTQMPRITECVAGHEVTTWVGEDEANEEMRRLAAGMTSGDKGRGQVEKPGV